MSQKRAKRLRKEKLLEQMAHDNNMTHDDGTTKELEPERFEVYPLPNGRELVSAIFADGKVQKLECDKAIVHKGCLGLINDGALYIYMPGLEKYAQWIPLFMLLSLPAIHAAFSSHESRLTH